MNLYTLRSPLTGMRLTEAWNAYDNALCYFEQGEFQEAAAALAAIELPPAEVPVRFLSEQVERELGFAQRRRSTDRPAPRYGVIALEAK